MFVKFIIIKVNHHHKMLIDNQCKICIMIKIRHKYQDKDRYIDNKTVITKAHPKNIK